MAALERIAPGHVTTVRAAVFDHLTSERTRTLSEKCEKILAASHRPPPPATMGLP
ncbi:hypothetical protein ACFV2N_11940 [Streptomyces sp. NPDC059680]|uniref:hypothetical protein n=1 Tax=Streptomyces sp. NPDC059680 TaxID=3346904 RepID=UPI0036B44E4F